MYQTFSTVELKEELERSLGFSLRSLERLDGASALNFKAVRDSDGMTFAVKCSPPERCEMFARLVRHLRDTRNTKAVGRIFERECPPTFRGCNLICLSWSSGVRMFPDELTDEQFRAFLDDYKNFSAVMQRTSMIGDHDPIDAWRREAATNCRGFFGRRIKAMMDRTMPEEDVRYRSEWLKVVHGDFHHGNFLFVDGRLDGILDLEEFCHGYPADDIVRYCVCAAEHLKWYEQARKRRILCRFAQAVKYMGYRKDEWIVAVNGLFVRKIHAKVRRRGVGLIQMVNLLFRSRFYESMRKAVYSASGPENSP